MKPKYFLLLLFSLYIVNCTFYIEAQATIRYVSKTGTSTPPYTTWQTAADSIQKCINIADVGDTIYVANGVYYESIYIDKTINLIGSSMDSTIINSINTPVDYIVSFEGNNSTFRNFTLTANPDKVAVDSWKTNLESEFIRIYGVTHPLYISNSSVKISNYLINSFYKGINDVCFPDTCHSVYTNNVIISRFYQGATPVYFSYGGYPVFSNNILIEENPNNWDGIYAQTSGAVIKNNVISGFYDSGIDLYPNYLTAIDSVYNNVITDMVRYGIQTSPGSTARIGNNIFQRNGTALISYSSPPARLDYNLFWNVPRLVYNQPFIGDSNIIASPMFVNDTIPRINGNYDYHLQAYSPAIDKGNPNILDKDGTRSDIGMFGGPLGETYTYQDLAPLAPRNLSALVDTNLILVKWNRNTETDTAFYKVYRDTVINFTIDSTKLISSQTDTFFIQLPPYNNSKYVYKISCVDNQGNESKPSIELVVNVTSVSTNEYPMTISDYILYQNYPNPFNPSTRIGYQLKDRANVKLMIYDLKGELITVLVNKEQTAGYYEVEFSSSSIKNPESSINGLASGIYLYRIEVIGEGNIPVYTEMKKMLLLK